MLGSGLACLCAGEHSYCEFVGVVTTSCSEDSFSQCSSSRSDFPSSSAIFPASWLWAGNAGVAFRAELLLTDSQH